MSETKDPLPTYRLDECLPKEPKEWAVSIRHAEWPVLQAIGFTVFEAEVLCAKAQLQAIAQMVKEGSSGAAARSFFIRDFDGLAPDRKSNTAAAATNHAPKPYSSALPFYMRALVDLPPDAKSNAAATTSGGAAAAAGSGPVKVKLEPQSSTRKADAAVDDYKMVDIEVSSSSTADAAAAKPSTPITTSPASIAVAAAAKSQETSKPMINHSNSLYSRICSSLVVVCRAINVSFESEELL